MNKFDKFDDEDFSIVCNEVTDMMEQAPEIFLARFRSKRAQDQRSELKSLHGPTYLKEARPDRLFWQHLTSTSYELYEDIYEACMINGGNGGKNIDCRCSLSNLYIELIKIRSIRDITGANFPSSLFVSPRVRRQRSQK